MRQSVPSPTPSLDWFVAGHFRAREPSRALRPALRTVPDDQAQPGVVFVKVTQRLMDMGLRHQS